MFAFAGYFEMVDAILTDGVNALLRRSSRNRRVWHDENEYFDEQPEAAEASRQTRPEQPRPPSEEPRPKRPKLPPRRRARGSRRRRLRRSRRPRSGTSSTPIRALSTRWRNRCARRAEAFGFADKIGQILIPTEEVVELRNGKKVTSKRLVYPGYVLVEMEMNDELWHAVKNTPRVTGFVGGGNSPVPLSADEVNRFCTARHRRRSGRGRR